ncbi:CoA transferase [Nocardia sp. NPDC004860]|uniref:CaiB/BaiF CoA transferase family protein n=1 Tax=Nocardia sp. NPDC004860 TaxID=3154557 RepID=UPI0033B14D44
MRLPLQDIRVLDLTDGLGESCGRFLGDLGAAVYRVEPPEGSRSRHTEPRHQGVSIPFAVRNANKFGLTADLTTPDGAERLRQLVRDADILVESFPPGWLAERGLNPEQLIAENPRLVWVSITPFGHSGPYKNWSASESVLYALSGVLSRSGSPGAEPLLPPTGLIEETVGVHAAWSALLAYFDQLRCGRGEYVDLSAFEAVVHGFDPGFGTQGSAAAGRSEDFPRGRPAAANFYPVFACADGFVRICLLAPRQWQAMFEWLGSPAEFADPKYNTIPARFAAADRLHPLIAQLFSSQMRDDLVAAGAARGVPVGGVLEVAEVLASEHFAISGALSEIELAPGLRALVPTGYARFDGLRAGLRRQAPQIGEHDEHLATRSDDARPTREGPAAEVRSAQPLDGLRVLDLGVIVFGAELSRQLADYGADVIKIENAAFPDGLRQAKRGTALSPSVAWGHRNKRSVGLDLRTDEGIRIFCELVRQSDILLANFKPGTLAAMGLSHERLAELNPRLIVSESSAFGSIGPWARRLGYGPLVRASCGVSALWRYPDDPELLCDGMTVYPDHVAAQVSATAVLAALIGREHTGSASAIEVAQSDTALVQLAVQFTAKSLLPDSASVQGNADPYAVPSGVFPCAGDDEWCAVSVSSDEQWRQLCALIDVPQLGQDPTLATTSLRLEHREAAERPLREWLRANDPREAMRALQEVGVAAGAMQRLPDLLTDPQLIARGAYTPIHHPQLSAPLPGPAQVAHFSNIPQRPIRPAPLAGEHTVEVCRQLLGMSERSISQLVDAGALQLPPVTADKSERLSRESVTTRRAGT